MKDQSVKLRPMRAGTSPNEVVVGTDVVGKGEPIQLGQLEINVQLTRFMNPTDHEDKNYLAGQPLPVPASKSYLGVFLTMKNHADSETRLPSRGEQPPRCTAWTGSKRARSSCSSRGGSGDGRRSAR